MTDDNAQPQQAAVPPIPWYRSPVLVGILTAACAQIISRVQSHYHVNLAVLGINATDLANWVLDTVSAGAIAWAAHARITNTVQPVTLTKSPKPPEPPAGA